MDELDKELSEILGNITVADLSNDVIKQMENGPSVVLFFSILIETFSQNLMDYECRRESGDQHVGELLKTINYFSHTINGLIPEEYHEEAVNGLRNFSAAIDFINDNA